MLACDFGIHDIDGYHCRLLGDIADVPATARFAIQTVDTNSLHEHEAHHGPADPKVEYALNKRLDQLYSNQREERVKLWQDVSRLRQTLPETAQQYRSKWPWGLHRIFQNYYSLGTLVFMCSHISNVFLGSFIPEHKVLTVMKHG